MPPAGAWVYCCHAFPDGFCFPAVTWHAGSNSRETQVPLNSPALRSALPVLFHWVRELTGYCADGLFPLQRICAGRKKTYTGYKIEIKKKKISPI